jgi:pyruvate/2-oxoglutarate dehydrogenase complex dihydrolipoamide acyltransferase (E2) component
MERHSSPPIAPSRACRGVALPPERRLVLDTLRLGHRKPMMHGLLELDVTRARRMLREHRARTGESLSFTAFVLACLGKAVAAHQEVHALGDWRGRVVLFDDVDATTLVEVEVDGRPFALAHVVRAINRRSVRDLHDELRSVQASGLRSLPPATRAGTRLFLAGPGVLRRLVYRALLGFPQLARRHTGTMLVTAVGMFGDGAGWGFSAPGIHNLSIVVGGIASRPPAAPGEAGPREILCLTVSANHALVDGAPVARFARDLSRRVAAAEGLRDAVASSPG